MDLKQQMTGTLGRIQIVFSSVSFFYAGTNPSSPAPLGLQQTMSRSSRSVTVFSLSLLLDASPWQQWGWSRPELVSIVEISSGKWIPRKWPFVCEERGEKKKISWKYLPDFDDFVFKLVKSMNRQEEINFLPFLLPTMFFFSLSRCCHDQTAALYTCVGLPRLLLFDLCST